MVPSVPVTLDKVACARAGSRAYRGTLAASDQPAARRADQPADDGPTPSAVMMSSACLPREPSVNESHEQQRRAQEGGEHSFT